MPDKFMFVDSTQRHNEATKRRARAHVMFGKNAGRKIKRKSKLVGSKSSSSKRIRDFAMSRTCEDACVEPPSGLGHALQSLALSVEVTMESAHTINHFFNSTADRMYPVHLGITMESAKLMWLRVLFVDELSYHCHLALMQTCNEVYDSNDGNSPKALHHIAQSYLHVQRILDGSDALSDASIAIVLSLISQEMVRNRVHELEIHFRGLVRMVQLRGGLGELEGNLALVLKICKIDVVCALQNGNPTTFCRDRSSGLAVTSALPISTSEPRPASTAIERNAILQDVLKDATSLSSALQDPFRPPIDILTFEDLVVSLCHRLLSFRTLREASQTLDHDSVVHLGLLLFSMTLFLRDRGRQIIELPALSRCLYHVVMGAEVPDPGLLLWISVLGGLWMAGGAERVYLGETMNEAAMRLGLESWDDAKRVLSEWPWITVIHDRPGCAFWEETFRSQGGFERTGWDGDID